MPFSSLSTAASAVIAIAAKIGAREQVALRRRRGSERARQTAGRRREIFIRNELVGKQKTDQAQSVASLGGFKMLLASPSRSRFVTWG